MGSECGHHGSTNPASGGGPLACRLRSGDDARRRPPPIASHEPRCRGARSIEYRDDLPRSEFSLRDCRPPQVVASCGGSHRGSRSGRRAESGLHPAAAGVARVALLCPDRHVISRARLSHLLRPIHLVVGDVARSGQCAEGPADAFGSLIRCERVPVEGCRIEEDDLRHKRCHWACVVTRPEERVPHGGVAYGCRVPCHGHSRAPHPQVFRACLAKATQGTRPEARYRTSCSL